MRRVICNDTDPQWLAERHTRITGSDMAVLLRKAKYPTNLSADEKIVELARIKHTLTWEEAKDEFEGNRIMRYGQAYEYVEMMFFQELSGAAVHECKSMIENSDFPGMAVTMDGLISFDEDPSFPADLPSSPVEVPSSLRETLSGFTWGDLSTTSTKALEELVAPLKGVGAYEQKTAGEWAFKGSKRAAGWLQGIPEYYYCQVQGQLAVSGLPWAIISCSGNRDRVAYVVYPDEFMHEELKQAVVEFWKT